MVNSDLILSAESMEGQSMSLFLKVKIPGQTPANFATPTTFRAESSNSSNPRATQEPHFQVAGDSEIQQYILSPIRAWVVEEIREDNGKLRAVIICSAPLDDHLWMVFDRSFEPKDVLAIYYSEEIPSLRDKTPEELKVIHKAKLAFPGARVVQEGPESK